MAGRSAGDPRARVTAAAVHRAVRCSMGVAAFPEHGGVGGSLLRASDAAPAREARATTRSSSPTDHPFRPGPLPRVAPERVMKPKVVRGEPATGPAAGARRAGRSERGATFAAMRANFAWSIWNRSWLPRRCARRRHCPRCRNEPAAVDLAGVARIVARIPTGVAGWRTSIRVPTVLAGRRVGLDRADGRQLEERHQAWRRQDVDALVPEGVRGVGGLDHDLDHSNQSRLDGHRRPPVQCGGWTRKSTPRPATSTSSATAKDRSLIRSRIRRPTNAPANITPPVASPSALVSGVRSA